MARPVILVIGSSGTAGSLTVELLEKQPKDVILRYSSRRLEQVAEWTKAGRDAVLLDLDDPSTFAVALHGVDRLLLITGYTVAMLTQSKTLVDAAKKAGVQHIVHLGIPCNEWDSTSPHFVWHQLVECYIQASGLSWTNLHPAYFMENLLQPHWVTGSVYFDWIKGNRCGWIAAEVIANVAVTVLRECPTKHHGKDYWLSTEVYTPTQIADLLTQATGEKVTVSVRDWKDFVKLANWEDTWFGQALQEQHRQLGEGRLPTLSMVRDDGPFVTGVPSLTLSAWVVKNKERLLDVILKRGPSSFNGAIRSYHKIAA